MLVEKIWQPTQKDVLSGLRQQRFMYASGSVSNAAAQVTVNGPVCPADTARFITMVSAQGAPGAAQFFEAFQFLLVTNGGTTPSFVITVSPPTRNAGIVTGVGGILCDIVMMPGDFIAMTGTFNAGGVANAIAAWMFGYDIPRANLT